MLGCLAAAGWIQPETKNQAKKNKNPAADSSAPGPCDFSL